VLGVNFSLFVLSPWFGPCWFLFFDSALQDWGATTVVGFFFFWIVIVLFGVLYGVQPLHPPLDMQLFYFPCLSESRSVIL
jgi:hypothetical protein